jgi:hypothetical protein
MASDLDKRIHAEIFGREILTDAQMQHEAEQVWKEQPRCCHFLMGFHFVGTGQSGPLFSQDIPRYSNQIGEAFRVIERLGCYGIMITQGQNEQWFCALTNKPNRSANGQGHIIAEAICQAALVLKGPESERDEGVQGEKP